MRLILNAIFESVFNLTDYTGSYKSIWHNGTTVSLVCLVLIVVGRVRRKLHEEE